MNLSTMQASISFEVFPPKHPDGLVPLVERGHRAGKQPTRSSSRSPTAPADPIVSGRSTRSKQCAAPAPTWPAT